MKVWSAALGIVLIATGALGQPRVPGFERFHAHQPGIQGGRLLYQELGCVHCHGGTSGLSLWKGPELATVTRRVQPDWLRDFLRNPARAHPGSIMPEQLSGHDPESVEAILHYLASLNSSPTATAKPPRHVNAQRGGELFHAIGCAACHTPSAQSPQPIATAASLPFQHLKAKYSLASLTEFIREPLKAWPSGRMPRISMESQDAVDMAGFLLGFEGSDGQLAPAIPTFKPDPALAIRGRGLFATLRCAACHDLPGITSPPPVAIRHPDGGCLAGDGLHGMPRYNLTAAQRASLKAYLEHPPLRDSPQELARHTLEALNCLACHERDGRGGPDASHRPWFLGDPNLGDSGHLPPPLTGIGRKLQTHWLQRLFESGTTVRPYLQTRMPVFGDATRTLAALLASADAKPEPSLPVGDIAAGRKLVGTQGGAGCIHCHRWGQHASLGIQALDISNLGQRLQPGWLREYLLNPAGYRPGTLMPSFWPDGRSANQDILGGDTERQIASILAFATAGQGEPEGYPSLIQGEFELIPKEQPIVLRTFVQGVGTHAILVGFPAGVHLAYDGRRARPVLAWQGRFFDAYATWFSRFAPFEHPLGDRIVQWKDTPDVASPVPVRFRGYRLDAQRIPEFLFTIGNTRVEERFEAIPGGLRRILRWSPAGMDSPKVTHPDGVRVVEDNISRPGDRRFKYLWP